jgi:hypothetical protein
MAQRCQQLRLALEPDDARRIGDELLRKNLDRDITPQPRIAGAVHAAHAAFADQIADLVRADAHQQERQRSRNCRMAELQDGRI